MLKSEQEITEIKMNFLSFAQTKAKLYWFDDDKRKRIFAIPHKTKTASLYGALYEVDYDIYKYKLHSYYYNMFPYTEKDCKYDYFKLTTVTAIPLRFNSLTQLQNNKTIKGEEIEVLMFAGNNENKVVTHNQRIYYKLHGIDVDSFIKLTKEKQNQNTKEK